MKILLALAVLFLVSTQLLAEEIGADDGLNYWSDWSDSDHIKVSPGPQLVLVVPPELGELSLSLEKAPRLAWRARRPRLVRPAAARGCIGRHP